jgi:hypothetical protein
MALIVMMETHAHKSIHVNLELVLDLIQLFVLHLINVTLLENVIHRLEFAVILQKMMTLIVMMEIHALKLINVKLELALDLIQLFVIF